MGTFLVSQLYVSLTGHFDEAKEYMKEVYYKHRSRVVSLQQFGEPFIFYKIPK